MRVTITTEYNQKNLTAYLQKNGLTPAGVGTVRDEAGQFVSMYVDIPEAEQAQLTTLLASFDDAEIFTNLYGARADKLIKAFALVIMDEINILRQRAGLPLRTAGMIDDAIKARLKTLG